jgi:DnaK suppressor protein
MERMRVETGELDGFRTLLLAERARLQGAVDHIHAEHPGSIEDELGEIGGGGSDNHLGDTASATFDRELDEGLEDGAKQTLADIEAALARIDSGTYGICEICGKPIGADRLRVIAWARFCIDDQRRVG